MEMSPEYADETTAVMAEHGYTLNIDKENRMDGSILRFESTRHQLRAENQQLILEVIRYPDGEARYFLEIARYGGLSSFSFELDSWKYRDDHVEFRYYTNPDTGGALTFKLKYPSAYPSPVR
jgi:hypothetical protein